MPKTARLKRISLKAARAHMKLAEDRYVDQDPLKLGIEPKIRPVVVVLIAHGFPTQNSCEGHLEGNLYPWVRFQPAMAGKPNAIFCSMSEGFTAR